METEILAIPGLLVLLVLLVQLVQLGLLARLEHKVIQVQLALKALPVQWDRRDRRVRKEIEARLGKSQPNGSTQ